MKTKITLFCTVTAIIGIVYWGCKKQQPENIISDKITVPEIMTKVQQNEFTVEEFEIELTDQLNSFALKTNPNDKTYDVIKEVKVTVADLKITMEANNEGFISKSELQRVFNTARNEVRNTAQNEFAPGKARVLGFLLEGHISVPPVAQGTIQDLTIKLIGVIGNGLNQLDICTITSDYWWNWNDPNPNGTMIAEMTAILNDITCAPPNYFSPCPQPGITPKGVPNGSVLLIYKTCMSASPFVCNAFWSEELSCNSPCPNSYLPAYLLNSKLDEIRNTALANAPVCPCGLNPPYAKPARLFNVAWMEETENCGALGVCKGRFLTVNYYYWCCGPCKAASIRLP